MEGDAMEDQGPGGGLLGLGCMACGSRDLEVTRPGWVEGAGDWLRFGGRWRPSSQRCRRCGQVDSDGSVRYLAPRTGWWRVPAQLVGVLRRRRSRVPVPATYLLAAAVGVVLGSGAQLAFGWPWWLVAAGVLAAVWLVFASGGQPRPPPTRGPGWSRVGLPVAGRQVAFDLLVAGRHWVAVGELQGRTLVLNARDLAVDTIELVEVADVEPYVEGTRRLEEASAHHRDHHA